MDKHPSLNAPLHQFEFYFHLKNIIEKKKQKTKTKTKTNKQTKNEKLHIKFDPSHLCADSRFASTIHTRLVFYRLPLCYNFKDSGQIIDHTK